MVDLDFLATIPIFGFFTRSELEGAEKLFKEVSFAKDDVVVRIGDPGDTFFVVLEGELEVWDAGQPPRQTGTIRRGDYFGEQALLQGGRRTATVTVARRARLLAVDKPAFDLLFLRNPKAIEYFAHVLSKRLASVTRAERLQRATTTIGVASPAGLKGESLIAGALASILKLLTSTEVIRVDVRVGEDNEDPSILHLLSDDLSTAGLKVAPPPAADGRAPAFLRVALPGDLTPGAYGNLLSNLVARLSDTFSFIVFDLGSGVAALVESASAYSDVFVALLERPEDDPGLGDRRSMRVFRVINLLNSGSRPQPISSSEPFVIPRHPSLNRPTAEAAEYIRSHPRSPAGLPIHRLAHKLLGTSVGLALGGGAAFGLAHLGVLKVLEEAGMAADLVAGCSQGSIIAVGYASGLPVSEMIDAARQLGVKKNLVLGSDLTFFTRPGILAGHRFVEMMRPYLKGKETFEQLLLPCRTVATDVETGERVAIGTGRLETAYRASSSVPMVMTPVRVDDRVLVDGGVADPVPAEVTLDMGADLTVAVNVVPRMKRGVETVLSAWYRRMNAFNPLNYVMSSEDMPNLFDIVMNSMQILQYELGNFKAISADVLINPDLSDFTWIEYYRADELIDHGARAAERALPALKKAISAKIDSIRRVAPGARASAGG